MSEKNYYMEVSETRRGDELISQLVTKLVVGNDKFEFSKEDGVSIEEAINFGMMHLVNQMMGGIGTNDAYSDDDKKKKWETFLYTTSKITRRLS